MMEGIERKSYSAAYRGGEEESEGVCGGFDREDQQSLKQGRYVVVCLPGAKIEDN